VILTERLILRRWRDADREPFAAINTDPEVAHWLGGPIELQRSNAAVDRYNECIDTRGYGRWALERLDDAVLIGAVGLMPVHESYSFGGVEIGWRLARATWGHGYAAEAAQAALEDGLGRAGLSEIVSFTSIGNVRSVRVMEKIGMARDPARDFDHPQLGEDHPLRRHVFYYWRSS